MGSINRCFTHTVDKWCEVDKGTRASSRGPALRCDARLGLA